MRQPKSLHLRDRGVGQASRLAAQADLAETTTDEALADVNEAEAKAHYRAASEQAARSATE